MSSKYPSASYTLLLSLVLAFTTLSCGSSNSSGTDDIGTDTSPADLVFDQSNDVEPGCVSDAECAAKLGDLGQCKVAVCDAASKACVAQDAPGSTVCDDQNPCTAQGTCLDGSCVPGENSCECEGDDDCTVHEDADLCNGTLICQDNLCVVDTNTVVHCDQGEDPACQKNQCVPATGECELQPLADQTACNDQDPCTLGDACLDGQCVGSPKNCNDQNPCTEGDACVDGNCVPGTWVCEVCGNSSCAGGETCMTCPDDCGECEVDCCTPHWTAECDDAYVKACVCQVRPECCTAAWNVACVQAVEELHCGTCPALCGDGVCSSDEECVSCAADCGVCPESCCWPQTEATCKESAITDFVCKQNPYCCAIAWTLECVELLQAGWPTWCCGDGSCGGAESCQSCPADCPCTEVCGDDICQVDENCQTCPNDCGACANDCCRSHASPGCDNQNITQQVCASMPQCCSEAWYPACLQQLASLMPGSCCGNGACGVGEDCQTCGMDCGLCEESCCAAHEQPGCNNDLMEFITCQIMPTCCLEGWTLECADLVLQNAPAHCCGDGTCMASETCDQCPYDCGACYAICGNGVCEDTLGEDCATCHNDCGYCPSQCGNSHCEPGETCSNCVPDCGLCHDCCQGHPTAGCEDPDITMCVCLEAPECCTQAWSGACALLSDTLGCGVCPGLCGNGECDGDEHCASCPVDCGSCSFDCCMPHPTAGCTDPVVTQAVCADHPDCCTDQWGSDCLASLSAKMPTYCCGDDICGPQESILECDDCKASSNCCTAHPTPSCSDPDIISCVCAVQPSCCLYSWSYECVSLSISLGCGTCPERCGDESCTASESCSTCPIDCGACEEDCCQAHAGTGCNDNAIQTTVCAGDPACCTLQWDSLCANAVDLLMPGACCGNGACEATEDCTKCPADCGICPSSCCTLHAGPGCNDPAVASLVCAQDPFCCQSKWDAQCLFEVAELAPDHCCGDAHCTEADTCESCPDECGQCPPGCCEEHASGGCSDKFVETCVCQFHPECCQQAWTEECVTAGIQLGCNSCNLFCGDGLCFGGEECTTCPLDCGPCATDCCSAQNGAGCSDLRAMEKVCAQLPFCCATLWTETCAQTLDSLVEGYCCGDAQCSAFEVCDKCVADCGECQAICGENGCEMGESCEECPQDCGACSELTCLDVMKCTQSCEMEMSCTDQCLAKATAEAAALYNSVIDCLWAACPDPDLDCLDQAIAGVCASLYQQCLGCVPNCTDKQCGSDGCSGICGECADGSYCSQNDQCVVYSCGDAECTVPFEGCSSCPQDCGSCPTDCCVAQDSHGCIDPSAMYNVCTQLPTCCSVAWDEECVTQLDSFLPDYCCGNGFCSHGESCDTCPQDCGPCQPSQCGDGTCSQVNAETCTNCPTDCGVCPTLDCWGLIVCSQACTNWSCIWNCQLQGTIQAKARFQELMNCVQPLCGSADPVCVSNAMQLECKDKYIACTGCLPQCEGRQCGTDGCKGTCGTCPTETPLCSPEGQCLPATGCGDGYCDTASENCETCADCGACLLDSCPDLTSCLVQCQLDAACEFLCLATSVQKLNGLAISYLECVKGLCPAMDAPCVYAVSLGACGTEWSRCQCDPKCGSHECGPDACAGSCGSCPEGTTCSWDGYCGPGCGDGTCGNGETCKTCPEDCDICPNSCCLAHDEPGCNDGSVMACLCFQEGHLECCSGPWTEACMQMAAGFACAYCGPTCGDGTCNPDKEYCGNCPIDCGECAPCGDNLCEPLYEDCGSCKKDCGNC